MSLLLRQFFRICLMQKGPQDLPWSPGLLYVCLLAYLVSGMVSMLPAVEIDQALAIMLADLAVLLVFAAVCLKAFGKSARFVQMATALAGVGVFFQLIAWPLMAMVDASSQSAPPLVSMLLLLVVGWNLAVYAHVFRESFNVRILAAFVLTLCYAVITVSVRQLLFPDAGV